MANMVGMRIAASFAIPDSNRRFLHNQPLDADVGEIAQRPSRNER
jgi:hypothetical protein